MSDTTDTLLSSESPTGERTQQRSQQGSNQGSKQGVRPQRDRVRYRGPSREDGRVLHRLVDDGGVLELNTGYSYVLMCDHFASTTVVAEVGEPDESRTVGFVTAYRPPSHPDAVFVWQIGVHPSMRGRGVARSILSALMRRPGCRGARFLEATVTPDNLASRRLFESFARSHGAHFEWSHGYEGSLFGAGHEPEDLIRIGPLTVAALS